jgi:hypothetical protein
MTYASWSCFCKRKIFSFKPKGHIYQADQDRHLYQKVNKEPGPYFRSYFKIKLVQILLKSCLVSPDELWTILYAFGPFSHKR